MQMHHEFYFQPRKTETGKKSDGGFTGNKSGNSEKASVRKPERPKPDPKPTKKDKG
ncbi:MULTISPECIES: hypothetical protein [unclassified Mesorhizobium]|uniref:hypothetical protein n=1 Tax=unclassified Mesorhizobium TaxID=325217 RepID=UPI00142ED586|nr:MULTISPECIES: hypothetical protein [unclassified Mesorhizobium]